MSAPTPPAPPPPPQAPPPPPQLKSKNVEGAPSEVTAPNDARLSLLESIRQAGGFYRANLKSAKDRKLGMIRKKGASGGEDLMGDLKEKMVASGRACPKLRNQQKGTGPTLPSGRRLPPGAVPMFGPR